MREPSRYNAIIRAIANGEGKLSDLADAAGRNGTPFILDIGRWWGTDPSLREQAEIDIVALCDDDTMICGECKWQRKPTDVDVLHKLQYRSKLIDGGNPLLLYLFSKSGFTDTCRLEAKKVGCRLITPEETGLG